MDDLPSSSDLSLLSDTVPSTTEHAYLLEGVDEVYHRGVTHIQVEASKVLFELKQLLNEENKKKTLGHNIRAKNIIRQMQDLIKAKEREMALMRRDRRATIKNLLAWERQREFGDGV